MAKVVNKIKENPKLMQKKMSDGRESLYLEYYLGYNKVLDGNGELKIKHHRKKEFLGLYLFSNPRTPLERQQNKDNLALVLEIRAEKKSATIRRNGQAQSHQTENQSLGLLPKIP